MWSRTVTPGASGWRSRVSRSLVGLTGTNADVAKAA
jgi:hypothetical protein